MDDQIRIIDLLNQKQVKQYELEKMIYGAVEIREKDAKKYIYTHVKEDGIQSTKYIGEYSTELHNLILNNNMVTQSLMS